MNKKTFISIAAAAALTTGCSLLTKTVTKVEYVPVRDSIQIPKIALEAEKTPKIPKILTEKEISKYILSLYIVATLNEDKIRTIKRIILRFNERGDYNATSLSDAAIKALEEAK